MGTCGSNKNVSNNKKLDSQENEGIFLKQK